MPPRKSDDADERLRLANVLAAFALGMSDKVNEAVCAASGRSAMASAALIQIGFSSGLSIERLRGMIGLSHSATVRVIDQLEGEGLVRRGRNVDGDSRVSRLALTKKGSAQFDRILKSRRDVTAPMMQRLDDAEIAQLSALLDKIVPAIVASRADEDVVCRLCDERSCPQDRCPVNLCEVG